MAVPGQSGNSIKCAGKGDTMSDFKHTPQPWEIRKDIPYSTGLVVFHGHFAENATVCRTWHSDKETQEANARLIAAAPDMYEALKDIRMSNAGSEQRKRGWDNALKIIEKIEGCNGVMTDWPYIQTDVDDYRPATDEEVEYCQLCGCAELEVDMVKHLGEWRCRNCNWHCPICGDAEVYDEGEFCNPCAMWALGVEV